MEAETTALAVAILLPVDHPIIETTVFDAKVKTSSFPGEPTPSVGIVELLVLVVVAFPPDHEHDGSGCLFYRSLLHGRRRAAFCRRCL